MAKECPCGCGRHIGMAVRRMANRGLYIKSLMPVAERMHERAVEEADLKKWSGYINEGKTFEDTFLAIAHDDPFGGVVSLADSTATLSAFRTAADDWEAVMLRAAGTLRTQDPDWFARWKGPRNRI